eukprot:scaffold81900_cov72-Phaeocystis_antarctica.AAC.3
MGARDNNALNLPCRNATDMNMHMLHVQACHAVQCTDVKPRPRQPRPPRHRRSCHAPTARCGVRGGR